MFYVYIKLYQIGVVTKRQKASNQTINNLEIAWSALTRFDSLFKYSYVWCKWPEMKNKQNVQPSKTTHLKLHFKSK